MNLYILPLTPAWQQAVVALYNRVCASLPLPYGRQMAENYLQKRLFDSALWPGDASRLLLTADGQLLGAVLANRLANPLLTPSNRLQLHWLGIDPAWQRQGLATLLWQSLCRETKAAGQLEIISALHWNGIWPGIVQGLTSMETFVSQSGGRWQPGELFLQCNVNASSWQQSLPHSPLSGVKINQYQLYHANGLRDLLQKHFSIGWQHETLSRVDPSYEPFNGYGLATTYCTEQPGRDVWIVEAASEVVGFCIVQPGPEKMAFFGPIGLRPHWRKQGLGRHLLHTATAHARALGCATMGLWTSQPLSEGFYLPLGMQKGGESRYALWSLGEG
ncbi:MAG: GNAT family N-acetyltransferase [Magnetococcales bacterium]|nr:GNAT family N-acetyltransferase [Magnetococcales bacterium]